MNSNLIFALAVLLLFPSLSVAHDSLAPLNGAAPPRNLSELWGGYDPRKEPLDVELVREWQEAGMTLRLVRYTIGTFKGQPSQMAAFYAFADASATEYFRPFSTSTEEDSGLRWTWCAMQRTTDTQGFRSIGADARCRMLPKAKPTRTGDRSTRHSKATKGI